MKKLVILAISLLLLSNLSLELKAQELSDQQEEAVLKLGRGSSCDTNASCASSSCTFNYNPSVWHDTCD